MKEVVPAGHEIYREFLLSFSLYFHQHFTSFLVFAMIFQPFILWRKKISWEP